MSQSQETSSLKRKRPELISLIQSLADADRLVLNVIERKEDLAIWARDIKREANLPDNVVTKSLRSLLSKKLIKEVVNIQNKGRKHYMSVEFEPSKEITGGTWYAEGNLDTEFINKLKEICFRIIRKLRVATLELVFDFVKTNNVTTVKCTSQQIAEILKFLVLENEIIEVKSTGLGEYDSIPVGTVCYRCASGGELGEGLKKVKQGAMASIPCGVCPRISQCTPDGIISPSTCVYFTRWLNPDF